MTVVDVDTHFDVELNPETHPLRNLLSGFPDPDQMLRDILVADLRRDTPPESRPDETHIADFLPDPNRSAAEQAVRPGDYVPRFASGAPETRLHWLDTVGIDYAFVNPGGLGFVVDFLKSDRPANIRRLNDFMFDHLEEGRGRLLPVALIDWTDLEAAISELEHARARGSRAFWIRAEPFNGMSPAHPQIDRLWSTATDLGMIAILHIGNTPVHLGEWANAGWQLPGSPGVAGYGRLANGLRHQPAELLLAAMVWGGVFDRHPTLTVLLEELLVSWLPFLVGRFEALDRAGDWPCDLLPSEMLRRNVRATPLVGLGDHDLGTVLGRIPEMLVFSSDYPHGEGNADPIRLVEPHLASFDGPARASFLGENILECFRRMGQPLGA